VPGALGLFQQSIGNSQSPIDPYLPVGNFGLTSRPPGFIMTGLLLSAKRFNYLKQRNPTNAVDQKTRARLLEAATALFAEKGYATTSVREIVARAGVTKPVLYYYFGNKEGLLQAILDWAADLQKALLQEVVDTSGSMLQRLIELYDLFFKGVQAHRNLFKLIHELIFGSPQRVPKLDAGQYHRRTIDAIKRIYVESLARNEVIKADPDEVALVILGIIDFCFHLDVIQSQSQGPDRAERLFRLVFQGLARRNEG
jgi:TetR/AcrR family transcriptional regulator